MNVGELIKELEKLPADLPVFTIGRDEDIYELDPDGIKVDKFFRLSRIAWDRFDNADEVKTEVVKGVLII